MVIVYFSVCDVRRPARLRAPKVKEELTFPKYLWGGCAPTLRFSLWIFIFWHYLSEIQIFTYFCIDMQILLKKARQL